MYLFRWRKFTGIWLVTIESPCTTVAASLAVGCTLTDARFDPTSTHFHVHCFKQLMARTGKVRGHRSFASYMPDAFLVELLTEKMTVACTRLRSLRLDSRMRPSGSTTVLAYTSSLRAECTAEAHVATGSLDHNVFAPVRRLPFALASEMCPATWLTLRLGRIHRAHDPPTSDAAAFLSWRA